MLFLFLVLVIISAGLGISGVYGPRVPYMLHKSFSLHVAILESRSETSCLTNNEFPYSPSASNNKNQPASIFSFYPSAYLCYLSHVYMLSNLLYQYCVNVFSPSGLFAFSLIVLFVSSLLLKLLLPLPTSGALVQAIVNQYAP